MKILWRDNDHVAMDSESRPGEVGHSLERVNDKWVCTCENATLAKNPNCKHVKYLEEQEICRTQKK